MQSHFIEKICSKIIKILFYMLTPSIIYLTWQCLTYRHLYTPAYISPFTVLSLYSNNVFVSLLLAIAFPLSLLVFRFNEAIKNPYLILSWIILCISYLEAVLLAEHGVNFRWANFTWGYSFGLKITFIFSFIEFYRWLMAQHLTKNDSFKIYIVSFILALHITSGTYYLAKLLLFNDMS